MKRWHAKSEDFETKFKELNLSDEIGATSLFANIGKNFCFYLIP